MPCNWESLAKCIKRFPVTIGFILAASAYTICCIAAKPTCEKWWIGIYYLLTGMLLSFTLRLWDEDVKNHRLKWTVNLISHLILAADAIWLWLRNNPAGDLAVILAHAAVITSLATMIFWLPFRRHRDDLPAWNFTLNTLSAFILSAFIGLATTLLLVLLTGAIPQLFGIETSEKLFLYIWTITGFTLPSLLLLYGIPDGERKHVSTPFYSRIGTGVMRYILLPVTCIYLIVLYSYLIRIIWRWELPDGMVSYLVTTLVALCIILQFGLYPTCHIQPRPIDRFATRLLPLMVVPLLILMTVGIVRRWCDYGITINRLYITTLNVWFYAVCIGMFLNRNHRLHWIPLSFAAVFLLCSVSPMNYANLTRHVLCKKIEQTFQQSGANTLPLQYDQWLDNAPTSCEEKESTNEKLAYLHNTFGPASTARLIVPDTTHNYGFQDIVVELPTATTSADEPSSQTVQLHYSYKGEEFPVSENAYSMKNVSFIKHIPQDLFKDSLLYYPVDADTLCFPLSELRSLAKDENDIKTFRSIEGKYTFVPNLFQITISQEQDKDIFLQMEGYLFKQNTHSPTGSTTTF